MAIDDDFHWRVPSNGNPVSGHRLLRENEIVRCGTCCIPRRWVGNGYEVLLLKRTGAHGAGTWSVPGGWIEYGEAPRMAAARELGEEVGLRVRPEFLDQVGVTSDLFKEEGKHCLTVWFAAFVGDVEPRICEPDKATELRWVDHRGPLPEPLFLPLQNYLAQGFRL